ncbi:hypothetical protein SFC08_01855 [Lysinibacillus halotolerans]
MVKRNVTLLMDNGREIHFSEKSAVEIIGLLNDKGEFINDKPIVINNSFGITTSIIYPSHISQILFS